MSRLFTNQQKMVCPDWFTELIVSMFIKKEEKDMTYGIRTRNRTEIMSQILRVANGVGATKTTLMNKAFLHYAQLQDYLMVLTQNDLLSYDLNTRTFDHEKRS
jgi:predicted transcriptional regulator